MSATHHSQPPPPPPSADVSNTNRSWFARHKILTAIGGILLLAILANLLGGGDDPETATPVADASVSAEVTPEESDPEAVETQDEADGDETPAGEETSAEAPAEEATPEETPVVEEEPSQEPAPEAATIGNGDHIVGSDIAPGVYRAEVEDSIFTLCTVSQSKGDEILDIRNANEGSVIFTVKESDGSVVSFSGCANIGLASENIRANPDPITNGDWLVGPELAPGTYRAVVDTDSVIELGTAVQTAADGDIMDIRNANEGNVVFTVKESEGAVVSFSGFKEISREG